MSIPWNISALIIILGLTIVIWDLFIRRTDTLKKGSGLSKKSVVLTSKSTSENTAVELFSEHLGLASRIDALVEENAHKIPLVIKPVKSIKDRHIAEMMIHLILVEEKFKNRPPYGIILLGTQRKRVQIKNTDERQQWVKGILEEMRGILNLTQEAAPSPSFYKCKNCDVRPDCDFSAYKN